MDNFCHGFNLLTLANGSLVFSNYILANGSKKCQHFTNLFHWLIRIVFC